MHLAIVTSHPIQYQAPLFRALAERINLTVYFAHRATGRDQAEAGFGVNFDWDTDLTNGFEHRFLGNVSRRPSVSRFAGCDTPSIGKILAAEKVDVLAVYGWHMKSYLQAALAARSLGIPVMARTDSDLETPRPLVKRAAKAFAYPVLLQLFDLFLACGARSARYLHHYWVPQSRIRTVPYCVDVDAFALGAERAGADRARLLSELGAEVGERLVLFVGKLIPRKAVPILIEALARLRAAGRAVRFVCVGSGPLSTELAQLANRLRLPASFVGFVNQTQMPGFYAAADVLVLPSAIDTWGLVVNEAFACGLPAVVSDRVGCAPDMIAERSTGSIFPAGNVARLADAIDYWLDAGDNAAVRSALAETSARYCPASSADAFVAAAKHAESV